MNSTFAIFFIRIIFLAMTLFLASCVNMLHMEKGYHCGLNSPKAEELNCSPYEARGQQENCLEHQTAEEKQEFTSETLEEYSHEGKARVATKFGGGAIPTRDWWSHGMSRPLLKSSKTARVDLDSVYETALLHSTQIKVFGNIPVIRETGIDEARGAFDGEFYSSTRLNRVHEPVGSSLTAGGNASVFTERGWDWETGVRKRFRTGAMVDLSQGTARTTNNSQFFIPNNQGNAELKLTVTQPMLRGAGIRYNESVIRIAKIDHEVGIQEFIRQLETHLTEVNRSFWALYLARAIYIEKSRIVGDTSNIVEQLRSRGNLDTMASQRARAESALASRQADLVRAELAIKNSESRLRALINDPSFIERGIGELIPVDAPLSVPIHTSFEDAVATAIASRPEVLQAQGQLKASNIREQMAKQDRLPELNLFGETSVSDLQGRGRWDRAVDNQFDDRDPSWMVGATVSTPIERRYTRARHLRSEVEFRQQQQQLRSTMETVQLEVRVAHREVTTAYPDMAAKYKAAEAAQKDLEVQERRRAVDGDGGENLTSIYLENLIEAQSRLLRAREEFLQSLIVYNVALTNLERAKGTLIRSEGISFEKGVDSSGLPEFRPVKTCLQATPVVCK